MGVVIRLLVLSTVAALASSMVLRVIPRTQSRRIFTQRSRPQFSFGSFSSIYDADTVNFGGSSSLGLRNSLGSSGNGFIMLGGDTPDAYNPFDFGDAPDYYPVLGSSFSSRSSGSSGYPMQMFDPDNTYFIA